LENRKIARIGYFRKYGAKRPGSSSRPGGALKLQPPVQLPGVPPGSTPWTRSRRRRSRSRRAVTQTRAIRRSRQKRRARATGHRVRNWDRPTTTTTTSSSHRTPTDAVRKARVETPASRWSAEQRARAWMAALAAPALTRLLLAAGICWVSDHHAPLECRIACSIM